MENLNNGLLAIRIYVNGRLCQTEPWKIITLTTTAVLSTVWIWQLFQEDESIAKRSKKMFFRFLKKIPAVSRKLKMELESISDKFVKDIEKRNEGVEYITSLPIRGMSDKDILNLLERCVERGDYDWKHGHVSGTVYYQNPQLLEMLTKVYGKTSYTNPLHSDVFPGVCKMEAEIVRITATLFHGGPQSCGTMTSGGSESIMMACKALRDYGQNKRGIRHGEIVLPRTAHPAFDKAASYLNMKITHVEVDPKTFAVNICKMERAISRNTVMLVGSVPNFPYGTADNIEEIAALGRKYKIPVHVDCCLGGFLTAFMPGAGYPVSPFDFALPGVVSISVDHHKYGFAPKGCSVVLYAEPQFRHQQYTVTTDWPGGIYGSPTVSGSRSGGTIAACWATVLYFGLDGYTDATRRIISTAKYIEHKLREIEGITIFGTPVTSVIAFGSEKFHIYKLLDLLTSKGWNLNPLQFPSGIHFCVTDLQTKEGLADQFLGDVKTAVEDVMKLADPQDLSEGKMAMYGVAQSLPDRSIVEDITCSFIDSLYFTPKQTNFSNGYSQDKV